MSRRILLLVALIAAPAVAAPVFKKSAFRLLSPETAAPASPTAAASGPAANGPAASAALDGTRAPSLSDAVSPAVLGAGGASGLPTESLAALPDRTDHAPICRATCASARLRCGVGLDPGEGGCAEAWEQCLVGCDASDQEARADFDVLTTSRNSRILDSMK